MGRKYKVIPNGIAIVKQRSEKSWAASTADTAQLFFNFPYH